MHHISIFRHSANSPFLPTGLNDSIRHASRWEIWKVVNTQQFHIRYSLEISISKILLRFNEGWGTWSQFLVWTIRLVTVAADRDMKASSAPLKNLLLLCARVLQGTDPKWNDSPLIWSTTVSELKHKHTSRWQYWASGFATCQIRTTGFFQYDSSTKTGPR